MLTGTLGRSSSSGGGQWLLHLQVWLWLRLSLLSLLVVAMLLLQLLRDRLHGLFEVRADCIILVAVGRMEVEHEKEVSALEGDDLSPGGQVVIASRTALVEPRPPEQTRLLS